MKFLLDLLPVLAMEAPEAVLPVVRRAAAAGNHLVVRRALDEIPNLGADDDEFSEALLRMTRSPGDPVANDVAVEVFREWVQDCIGTDVGRLSRIAMRCMDLGLDRRDGAARVLVEMGADPLFIDGGGEREIAGACFDLRERQATLTARALYAQSTCLGDLVRRTSTRRRDGADPMPTVAQVRVNGTFHPVNAAGYALAIGDLQALDSVISNARGDVRSLQRAWSDALVFALDSGLVREGTSEVHHGVCMLVAAGADLATDGLGNRLATSRVSLAQAEGEEPGGSVSYALPTLFLGLSEPARVATALARLAEQADLDINAPVSSLGNGATLLHYAAVGNRAPVVAALLDLRADASAQDSRGLRPLDWARRMGCREAAAALGDEPVLPMDEAGSPEAWVDSDLLASDPPALDRSDASYDGEAPALALEDVLSQTPPDNTEPPTSPPSADDRIAPSISLARASRGAALFDLLKASQQQVMARVDAARQQREAEAEAQTEARVSGQRSSPPAPAPEPEPAPAPRRRSLAGAF